MMGFVGFAKNGFAFHGRALNRFPVEVYAIFVFLRIVNSIFLKEVRFAKKCGSISKGLASVQKEQTLKNEPILMGSHLCKKSHIQTTKQ